MLKKLLKGIDDKDDRENLNMLVNEEYVDPTPNLIEGIFWVPQDGVFARCCKCCSKKN